MNGLRIKGLGEEIATLANLPWDQSLENWPEDEVLTGMRGISRHVVRLIRSNPNKSNSEIFAVKETVPEFANREYTLLRDLNQQTAPAVEPVAVIEGRVAPAQLFHEVLENRWYLGEKLGRDVGLDFSTADYIEKVLPYRMDSGVVITR